MLERQELYCHHCENYVQFNLDTELNGEHILNCPVCGHKHYRYVNDGKISDKRWGRDPSQQSYQAYSYPVTGSITYSASSTFTVYLRTEA